MADSPTTAMKQVKAATQIVIAMVNSRTTLKAGSLEPDRVGEAFKVIYKAIDEAVEGSKSE